jgi:hypothetical protein
LKNRLGKKDICLLCSYDPGKVFFVEKAVLNTRVLLDDKQKKKVETTVKNIREKLNAGEFLKK